MRRHEGISPLPDGEAPPLVVLPDFERLEDPKYAAGKAGLRAAFANLAGLVAPAPDNDPSMACFGRLRWVSLEPSNPDAIPPFHWEMRSKLQGTDASNRLVFEAGAWTLLVSDQPLG